VGAGGGRGGRKGGEMTQTLYAHMNINKNFKKRKAKLDKWNYIKLRSYTPQSK
jgi:hypothetical protein